MHGGRRLRASWRELTVMVVVGISAALLGAKLSGQLVQSPVAGRPSDGRDDTISVTTPVLRANAYAMAAGAALGGSTGVLLFLAGRTLSTRKTDVICRDKDASGQRRRT